jgi:hypothetical protein
VQDATADEVLDRLARLAAAGGLVGVDGLALEDANELERACAEIPTEASAQAVRCARGELGVAAIRAGRRHVTLAPLGAMTFYFDPTVACEHVAPLTQAVLEAESLESANETLHARGLRTELDYERALVER